MAESANIITPKHPLLQVQESAAVGEQLTDPNKQVGIREGLGAELSKVQQVLEYLKALYR